MRRVLAWTVVVAALFPADISAHRLDEYLQAARVALLSNGVRLELDLTPGANIAASIVEQIDVDPDRRFSAEEIERYARRALRDLDVSLDGSPLHLELQHVDASTPDELLHGVGTLHIVANVATVTVPGRHSLKLRNRFEVARSVYLMNALVPEVHDVVITAQSRDGRQQEFGVEYDVRESAFQAWWMIATCLSLGALAARRHSRQGDQRDQGEICRFSFEPPPSLQSRAMRADRVQRPGQSERVRLAR